MKKLSGDVDYVVEKERNSILIVTQTWIEGIDVEVREWSSGSDSQSFYSSLILDCLIVCSININIIND